MPPEVIAEVEAEVVPERTLREEIEAAAEEANARHANDEPPAEPAVRAPRERSEVPVETPRPEARPRNAAGQFLSATPAAPAVEPPAEPTPETPAPVEPEPVVPEVPVPEAAMTAPAGWTAETKAKFGALPPDVREQILKRETDIVNGFRQLDSERAFGRELRQIVQPYEAILRAGNTTPQAAIASVLNTAYVLRTADAATKLRTLQQVAKDYGVDLNLLSPGTVPGSVTPQPFEPIVSGLTQRLDQQEARWQQWQNQQHQAAEQAAVAMYQAFSNNPANKYFAVPEIQTHMGALMQGGVVKTLEEAYKMACAAQPEVASRIAAENTAVAKAAEAKRLAAEKARRKATSVRGGSGGYTPPAANAAASVRDDILAAIEESNSRI